MKINNLSFGYTQRTPLLNGLTLNLEPGHVYGLLGQNGAGKTTLLKIMAGLCYPNSGTCSVLSEVPAERRPEFLVQLFFMPESFNLPPMTVEAYQKYYGVFYPHFDPTLFEYALEAFGLGMQLNLAHFSHGQKKMFMMSFALATRAALLILDEPTNGLDIPNKQIWQSLFAKEIREEQLVIVSTHQVHDVEHLIDSVLIMKSGKIIVNAPLHEVEAKLHFGFTAKMPTANSVLYTEQRPGGYAILTQNEHQEDSAVDLTLLFNAAISNTQVAVLIEEKKMFKLNRFYDFLKLNLYLLRKLIMWLGIVFGFLFLFSANVGPSQSFFFTVSLFIGGFMLTSQAFAEIHNPNLAIQALTLPVSSSERYLALWLLTGPIYFIALLLLYSIAILAHILSHFFWGDWQLSTLGLADLALEYFIFNAFFLLGAVLFKRLALIKTLLSLFILFLLSVSLRAAFGDNLPLLLMNWGSLIFWGTLAIVSWCFGWYRLKQIQLK